MNRSVAITGMLLLAFGLAVFAWKTAILGLPIVPTDAQGLWRVELEITARGTGRRGSIRVPLPSSDAGQVVFDERSTSERLVFTIRTEDDGRVGVWSGRFSGIHDLVHGFRVQLRPVNPALPQAGESRKPPPELAKRYTTPTSDLPSDDPEVEETLEDLRLPPDSNRVDQLRTIFSFVSDEVATVPTGSDDAVLTLAAREGSARGKTHLLVSLLRAAGVPARVAVGLRLREGVAPATTLWGEAWVDGRWLPMSPVEGFFASRPGDRVRLGTGSADIVQATSVAAVGHRYRALRERLRPEELATMMLPPNPILAKLSLYQLPVATQAVLRALLVMPLGALVVTLFRNIVGVPTFGTFMPVLIAMALRETALGPGLLMVAAVLVIGIFGRLVLERLQLLLVPRLSILLCLVVLSVTLLALLGDGLGERDLTAGVLFPMVILTMLIERFSVTIAEEGIQTALIRAACSVGVAVAVYPLFRSTLAAHLMFGFPELVISTMGVLVLIGGYTGYRASDLLRFRVVARLRGGAA